jgi:hypothetical protein
VPIVLAPLVVNYFVRARNSEGDADPGVDHDVAQPRAA